MTRRKKAKTSRQLAKLACYGLLRGARKAAGPSALVAMAMLIADCISEQEGACAGIGPAPDASTHADAGSDAPADHAPDVVDAGND